MMQADRVMVKLLLATVSALGLFVFAYSLYLVAFDFHLSSGWLWLSVATLLSVSRIDTRIAKAPSAITASDGLIFVSILLYGPMPSVALAGADAVAQSLSQKNRRAMTPFNVAAMSLPVFASANLIAFAFGGPSQQAWSVPGLIVATAMIALAHYSLKSAIMSLATISSGNRTLLDAWRDSFFYERSFLLSSMSYLAVIAAAFVAVNVIISISLSAFLITMLMLVVTYLIYKVYADNEDARNLHVEQMADLHLRTIEALAVAIDAKDEVTHDHVFRVQVYATGLARLFGLSEPEIEALKAGALLHDIGKLAVPDYILNKPGKLTPAEFDKMKIHTIVGAEILERVSFPYPVVPVVRHHHERWDGRGYPDGLKGEQIPITARIITVVDCFDAVREDRQYRKAMTREEAIELLKSNRETMYDPAVVDAFIERLPEFEAEIRRYKKATQSNQKPLKMGLMPVREDAAQNVYERIRESHREVATLYEIAATIGSSLDLRDTFAVFSSRLQDIVSYTTCALYLLKQDSTDVEAVFVSGRNAEQLKGRRMASGAGISGWVVANGHPMHNSDPRLDFDTMKAGIREQYRTSTVVPLLKGDKAIGALALYSAELTAYDAEHLRLLEGVAKLAADAITRSTPAEKIEVGATTDPLTGLPNARALRCRFEVEADRARRHKDDFSVVMIDLDGFRNVNEQFSPLAGDHLLREFSDLLSKTIRSSDFVGRYSGDKFVALLQVGSDEAQELVNRIQKSLNRHDFRIGSSSLSVGISIGWACFGADGDSLDELLLAAYRTMYADKARRKAAPSASGYQQAYDLRQYKVM